MRLNEVAYGNRDPLQQWFEKEHTVIDYVFDNIEMSDRMDDYLAAGIDDMLSKTRTPLYFPNEMIPTLKKAIENDSAVQSADLLRGHLTTYEDWENSPEGEEAQMELADDAEYNSDPYKYHGVRRSDF